MSVSLLFFLVGGTDSPAKALPNSCLVGYPTLPAFCERCPPIPKSPADGEMCIELLFIFFPLLTFSDLLNHPSAFQLLKLYHWCFHYFWIFVLSYINSLTVTCMRFGKELRLMHVFNFCLFISLPVVSSFPLIPSLTFGFNVLLSLLRCCCSSHPFPALYFCFCIGFFLLPWNTLR